MKIAIFGSDPRAVAIGRLLREARYDVSLGDAAPVEAVEDAAREAGAGADTPYNEASVCDMLIFACSRDRLDGLLAKMGPTASDTVVVDAMEGSSDGIVNGAEELAHKIDSYRVVRALITLAQPGANVLYCGDDPDAMTIVEEVFSTAGCELKDCGLLANAGEIETPKTDADKRDSSAKTSFIGDMVH